jgi:iron-regulated transporter 1
VTAIAEYLWIQVVYSRFPILASHSGSVLAERASVDAEMTVGCENPARSLNGRVASWLGMERADWAEFAKLPIFCSECRPCATTYLWAKNTHAHLLGSLAIAAIYLTTLSYGTRVVTASKAAGHR